MNKYISEVIAELEHTQTTDSNCLSNQESLNDIVLFSKAYVWEKGRHYIPPSHRMVYDNSIHELDKHNWMINIEDGADDNVQQSLVVANMLCIILIETRDIGSYKVSKNLEMGS